MTNITKFRETDVEIRAGIINYFHIKGWDDILHPYIDFNGVLANPPLELQGSIDVGNYLFMLKALNVMVEFNVTGAHPC